MKGFVFILVFAAGETVTAAPPARRPEAIFTGAESGGQTTSSGRGRRAYAMPLANLRDEHRPAFTVGNSLFNENWVAAPASAEGRDGLGPLFHARSCSACHELDGRGRPPEPGETMTSLLLRISVPTAGGPQPHPVYGSQLAPRALPGLDPEASVDLAWEDVPISFPDGTQTTLRKPRWQVKAWHYGNPGPDVQIGARVAPPVFGLGLLEAVPAESIASMADPDDRDGDGISGRPNYLLDPESGKRLIGRFGWKANAPTLRSQTADALLNDMGLTSPVVPEENHTAMQQSVARFPSGGRPELSESMLSQLTHYVRTLAPPARRNSYDHDVREGQKLFHLIGCASCHRQTLTAGLRPDTLPEIAGQRFHPYTDLLLHDMGEGLADGRPDGEALEREWRTAPLWGLGLLRTVNGHDFLLHDGRARGVEEAILWHGGESQPSRDRWMALPATSRNQLVVFLGSL
jgi:CxxC motif-containing protein (DUF1111 family)